MNGRETMGQLAQRVRASLHKYRLVWLVILVGLFLLLLPTDGGEGRRPPPNPPKGPLTWKKPRPAGPGPNPRSRGWGDGDAHRGQRPPRQVLAQDVDRNSQQGEESTQTVILSRGSSSQETVTVQEIYPRYQGALVVCPGGDDPEVRLQITEALSALTGLGADKISISEGK